MTTSTDIVNQAIQLMGDNTAPVTGTAPSFDSSDAGVAASYLYAATVQTVGRQFGWDFSRSVVALTASGNTPPPNYANEYLYPTNGVQVRQLFPASPTDVNDPPRVNWSVGNTLVGGVSTKVIWTNLGTAYATFSNQPSENTWDPLFRESVVRLLSSGLAMALAGKPETARQMIETGAGFENLGEARDS